MSVLLMGVILLAALFVFFILLGHFTGGTGADVLDWDPAGRAERKAELDRDDLADLQRINAQIRRPVARAPKEPEDLS